MHKFSLFVLYFAPFFSGLPHKRQWQMMVHLHFVNEITIEDRILNCNLLFWKEKKRLKRDSNYVLFSKNMSGIFWHLSFGSYNINLTKKSTWVLSNSFFLTIVFITKGNLDSTSQHLCPKKSLPQAQLADSRYPSQKIR